MASVFLENIKKSFGHIDVIHGVNIKIDDGEFVALVGPSGCGKSTLLRMIAGLEDPTSGNIHIGENIINDRLPKDRDIAMVFQSYALYPHMTVRKNISFSLELEKKSKAEIDEAVNSVSEILGLDDYLDRLPKALSGGQRQRVAMGRAIVRHPSVFLFDEPLSNLDAKLRGVMRKEIKKLHHRLKTTSIYVTHDQTEAMTMADKIVVMRAGKVEQIGNPIELYKTPTNVFVASFIGSPQMNFFHGVSARDENGCFVDVGGIHFPIAKNILSDQGQKIALGIRPEHLFISDNPQFTARIEVVEPLGNATHLTCTFENNEIQFIAPPNLEYQPGDNIALSYDVENVHLFDSSSENRIIS